MVTCFELLVVNNWFVLASGFSAVAPMWQVRLFFTLVYIFGVLVCLNIVVAFAIEAFDKALEDSERVRTAPEDGIDAAELEEQSWFQRAHSESIAKAQARFRPVIPAYVPEGDRAREVLQRSKIGASSEAIGHV